MRLSHKFHAVPTTLDGITFDSKAEGRYYLYLKAQQAAGEIVGFLRQVPIHLPGKTRYVCDFLVFTSDGEVKFIDVKGMETPAFKRSMKQVKALYPWLEVETVKAK